MKLRRFLAVLATDMDHDFFLGGGRREIITSGKNECWEPETRNNFRLFFSDSFISSKEYCKKIKTNKKKKKRKQKN